MRYTVNMNIRLTEKQYEKVKELAKRNKVKIVDVIRNGVDVITSDDYVVVPLTRKERQFIEAICEETGVLPEEAVKMVLLAYQTLLSRELWKIIKPIDEILREERNEGKREV